MFDYERGLEMLEGLEDEMSLASEEALAILKPLMLEVDSGDPTKRPFLDYVFRRKEAAVTAMVAFANLPQSELFASNGKVSAAVLEIHGEIRDYSRVVDYLIAVISAAGGPSGDGSALEGEQDDAGDYDGREVEAAREPGRRVVRRRRVIAGPGPSGHAGSGGRKPGPRAKPAGKRRPAK